MNFFKYYVASMTEGSPTVSSGDSNDGSKNNELFMKLKK